jgi:hypothetical protein
MVVQPLMASERNRLSCMEIERVLIPFTVWNKKIWDCDLFGLVIVDLQPGVILVVVG